MYKDPVTDHGKISKKGLITLEFDENGKYVTRTEGKGDPAKVMDSLLWCCRSVARSSVCTY